MGACTAWISSGNSMPSAVAISGSGLRVGTGAAFVGREQLRLRQPPEHLIHHPTRAIGHEVVEALHRRIDLDTGIEQVPDLSELLDLLVGEPPLLSRPDAPAARLSTRSQSGRTWTWEVDPEPLDWHARRGPRSCRRCRRDAGEDDAGATCLPGRATTSGWLCSGGRCGPSRTHHAAAGRGSTAGRSGTDSHWRPRATSARRHGSIRGSDSVLREGPG